MQSSWRLEDGRCARAVELRPEEPLPVDEVIKQGWPNLGLASTRAALKCKHSRCTLAWLA